MAHARMTISLMDSDLVEGMVRAILALHAGNAAGACGNCLEQSPCSTVRIIASFQEAALYRVSNPEVTVKADPAPFHLETAEIRSTGPQFHAFKYPECPEFSGGICERHHGRPLHNSSAA